MRSLFPFKMFEFILCLNNVWKFWDISVSQILREIIFEDSGSAKSAISTQSGSEFWFFVTFCTFWKLKFNKWTKLRALKIAKTAVLKLLDSQILISHKIWMTEKSWNFHTVFLTKNNSERVCSHRFVKCLHLSLCLMVSVQDILISKIGTTE